MNFEDKVAVLAKLKIDLAVGYEYWDDFRIEHEDGCQLSVLFNKGYISELRSSGTKVIEDTFQNLIEKLKLNETVLTVDSIVWMIQQNDR
jgi:hypothetical protein